MANTLLTRGFSAVCVCLALSLGAGPANALGQQDQGPPQYPQQDQGQPQASPPPPQDQGPSQYPQQDQGSAPPSGPQQQGSADVGPQGPAQSPSNVARVSFVQGDVKMTSSGQTDFQQAVANMPLVANSSLQTGQDGQAEVEFADGSVVRLTPNSSLALNQMGQDAVGMQQNSGLVYYELNVGQGHPPFRVDFPNVEVVPTANTIFRMDLDSAPEVAVMTGSVEVSGNGIAAAPVSENQSIRFQSGNGAPYTIAQSLTPDSWDQWNQDRDQAISQEASQQTSVRDNVGDSGDENWNDLDAYGNWYPVQGSGNVWVPAGISAGWDPYGYGYWGDYPGFGYTYISGYPWGWLPYHCGAWNYFSFGWGWAPGGCGRTWFPVAGIHGYPGYFLPRRPGFSVGFGANRLVMVNRGAAARGPWGAGHALPVINHAAALNVGGRTIAPIGRTAFHEQAGAGVRGTSPGVRTALRNSGGQSFRSGVAPTGQTSRPAQSFNGQAYQNRAPAQPQYRAPAQPQYRAPAQPQYRAPAQPRPSSRTGYAPRSMPTPHYSAPPAPRSAPAPRASGGAGRR